MVIEHRQYRSTFLPTEVVELRQVCFTPGRVFEPGKYIAGDLPNVAFEMGLVDRLPPIRGKNAEIRPKAGSPTSDQGQSSNDRSSGGERPPKSPNSGGL